MEFESFGFSDNNTKCIEAKSANFAFAIDQYKKQMGDLEKSFDAHKSDEDSLREEKATFLGKINALESERGE